MRPLQATHCILLALLLLAPGPRLALAQSNALLETHNHAKALYQQGMYDDAVPFAVEALNLSEEEFGRDNPGTAV